MKLRSTTAIAGTAGVVALLLPATSIHAAETIRPGYWESVNRVMSPIQITTTDRRCIQTRDIDKFLSCYINHHYDCVCPHQSASGGKIVFRGVCVDHQGRKVELSGHGEYTPTTLRMTADFRFKLLGIPLGGEATTQARRIADACPAAGPRAPGR